MAFNNFLILLIFALLSFTGSVYANKPDTLLVAVASNFKQPMESLVQQYQQQTSTQIKLSIASTGALYQLIEQGAPFDLYLAADRRHPEYLLEAGIAVDINHYINGRLVLWSKNNAVSESNAKSILKKANFKYLAIANPKIAPYGAATMQIVDSMELREVLQPKFVIGNNIAQAYQFVASGNAEFGFVALSQVYEQRSQYWLVPEKLYSPIEQYAALLKDHRAARDLFDFLQTSDARTIFLRYGYMMP